MQLFFHQANLIKLGIVKWLVNVAKSWTKHFGDLDVLNYVLKETKSAFTRVTLC